MRGGAGSQVGGRVAARWGALAPLGGLLLAACVVPLPAGGAGGAGATAGGGGTPAGVIARFAARLDAARRDAGCAPLAWDDAVAAVAQTHTDDMARRGYLSHDTPEGQDPFDRLRAAGIGYHAAAENIAEGPRDGDRVFSLWWNSVGHRRNMLDCTYTRHGVGYRDGYWTDDLIRP